MVKPDICSCVMISKCKEERCIFTSFFIPCFFFFFWGGGGVHLIPMSGSPLHSSSHLILLGGSKSPILPTSSLSPSGVITVFAIRINQLDNVIIFFIVLTMMMPFPTRDYDVGRILIQPFMQRELEPLISIWGLCWEKTFYKILPINQLPFFPQNFSFFKSFYSI